MVLLVVDAQRMITTKALYEFNLFEKRIKELIKQAKSNSIEVIYVRHDDGAGNELTKK